MDIDALDRKIIVATQGGLPLVPRPYHRVAEQLGVGADEVMRRIERMRAAGVIRRIIEQTGAEGALVAPD